ncbi:uncharacterized protein C15orf41 homolog [Diachasma alloeum]|uniref:uncharacterized protein C15orf41 homolog n=1 Tax=Diachasma alloeum TaxID=454923 RepID=UPI00073812A7|nr:uncharacterized protein C15orf41 homolog [Diachasma alloeum]
MKPQLYEEIVKNIKNFKGLSRDCAYMLIHKYPDVPPTAIHGILSSEMQLKSKQNRGRLHSVRVNYLQKYMTERNKPGTPPGIIVRMAAALDFSPTLLARVILEKYLQETNPLITKGDVSKCMKDTTQIQDPRLAHEIYMCILYDDRNGMISDAFCNAIGFEYEVKLETYLEERNIPYLTEEKLKTQGYDKTPDVKLELPIAVDGFIINWIESKARFGTPSIHKTHLKEQYLSYWNRFGPGLVIYWFGFVDDLSQPSEKKFIILDHFPENITYMNPLIEVDNCKSDEEES